MTVSTPLVALEGFWLAQAMKYSSWLYPTVETLHLWGIGMLFGSVVLMDLRVLGVAKVIDFSALSRLGVTVSVMGFGLAVLTGSMLFITHASELIASSLFVIKMCLIFLLLCNAVLLRMRDPLSRLTQLQAVISLLGWASVIGLGRWLAYA
jgi:hypothetical protein